MAAALRGLLLPALRGARRVRDLLPPAHRQLAQRRLCAAVQRLVCRRPRAEWTAELVAEDGVLEAPPPEGASADARRGAPGRDAEPAAALLSAALERRLPSAERTVSARRVRLVRRRRRRPQQSAHWPYAPRILTLLTCVPTELPTRDRNAERDAPQRRSALMDYL